MADNTIKIGGELESMATGKIVAAASAIKDKSRNKTQEVINGDVEAAIAEQSVLFEALSEETSKAVESASKSARESKQYLADLQEAITELPDGQAVSAQVAINEVDIAGLKSKTDSISKQSTQSEEDAIIYETDGGVRVGKIDSTGADFTNLKRGGQQVARMSDLPTKDSSIEENPSTTNVPTTKAVKDYVDANAMGALPISKESTQSEDEELEFVNDAGSQSYAKVGSYGVKAKAYKKMNGDDAIPPLDTTIGDNPSNAHTPSTAAVKDYVDTHGGGGVGDLPITKQNILDDEEKVSVTNDNGTQTYMEIDSNGVRAEGYFDSDGNKIIGSYIPNDGVFYNDGDKILLTGASFATANATDTGWTPEINGYNRWFEDACSKIGVVPINHAIGGQSIVNTASMMRDADSSKPHGSLFMDNGTDIFNDVSVFVIMHVHNQDVYYTGSRSLSDYITNGPSGYAQAFDYVIKQYTQWCIDSGKYCQILLCTHWHDARVTYNNSIRRLALKWGLPLCQFDTSIGFSRHTPLDDGKQISVYNSWDPNGQTVGSVETIDGVVYGWHMKKPTYTSVDDYQLSDIQKRMSKIFQNCFK